MSTLYISEYAEIGAGGATRSVLAAIVAEPPLAEQTVSISGSSTQSNAFGASSRIIRVHTDAICSILIGSNPTATAAKKRLAANATEYFAVNPGDKLAVITNT